MAENYSAAALLLLGGLSIATAQAQQKMPVLADRPVKNDSPTLVQLRGAKSSYALSEANKALREQLQLATNDQLLRTKTSADALGYVHEKYQQYYRGIKVEHGDYTVHAKQGQIESLSGRLTRIEKLEVQPALAEAAALQRALSFVGARQYMWQDANEEALLQEQQQNPAATYKPKGELVILGVGENEEKPVLAWKFNVYAKAPVSRAYLYVDAHSGEVVFKDDIIKHAAATGNFATAYSGTRSLATDSYNGSYRLREATRGNGIETYNCKKGNSYTSAVDFTDADNNWTAAEYNNANFDNAAGDAHFGAQATYDYWKNIFGRNSYDGAGAKIRSYVHFDDTPGDGKGFENAYWNGSVMTYGDGGTRFRPLTALDVCAHEIGHAICEKTANLTYSYESGAMNEGFSDIWGACVEQYNAARYGLTKNTWLIGEDIDKQQAALRSMSDPKAMGQPAFYKGQYWYAGTLDNGGVHTNSGVLNHWFYILTQGKSGTNEGGNSYSVTGVGIIDAAKIAFRTEDVYLTSSSNYAAARTYSIQAATDLFGAGSAQVIATTNAWYAVGVGAAYSGGGTTTPPPTTVAYCTSKGNDVAYEWIDYVKLGSIARTSGKDGGYYDGTALSTSIAAGSSQTISFSAGFASSAYTENWDVYIDYNQDGDFSDAGENVVGGSSSSSSTLSATFTVPTSAKTGKTRLRIVMSDNSATTSCGTYGYGETEDYSVNITGGTLAADNTGVASLTGATTLDAKAPTRQVSIYPNPATDHVAIALPDNGTVAGVEVMDIRGAKLAVPYTGKGELNVSTLAKGVYILSISDGQKTFHQRFVKE
ncbi:M4 family metallopeptidase [Hymenobacter aerilatus]|uniref:M4 family metallopeptidase n=1 Tax=Hymenobacter aerilatus TaxID=2932251 RepID=A0A8T9STK1_9BACT|nr:M4 family metallopeptidase [Hymenobacter aerilatus]UOR05145.1 M4 family metallopeptidase [Hymenobacter aerilatus]